MEKVWSFKTKRFEVALFIEYIDGYQYDGDDEDGETQRQLDNGELVAFDSLVTVTLDGLTIGSDSLGSSVYRYDCVDEFWTAHRDKDPMNRNCSIMRADYKAKTGHGNVSICHYFPGMVLEAIKEARNNSLLSNPPRLRDFVTLADGKRYNVKYYKTEMPF